MRKVLGKLVKLSAIKSTASLADVNTDLTNQLSDDSIFAGFIMRHKVVEARERGRL